MSITDTDSIENRLKRAESYDDFYKENSKMLKLEHPGEYIVAQLKKRNMKKTDLISKVNLNTGYVYEILRQEKSPERNKVLQFALALKLNIEETQDMLRKCGYAMLYGKNPRDSVIIFCISRKKNLIDTNMLLHKYNYEQL